MVALVEWNLFGRIIFHSRPFQFNLDFIPRSSYLDIDEIPLAC